MKSKINTKSKKIRSSSSSKTRKGFSKKDLDGTDIIIGHRDTDNDLSWYTQTLSLLDPVTKVPMVPIHGTDVNFRVVKYNNIDDTAEDTANTVVPGVMKILYTPLIPTLTPSTENVIIQNDMFATVGKAMYAQLRRVLNGPRQYNTADLMAYILVVSSITSQMEQLRRSYNSVYYTNVFSRYNRQVLVDFLGQNGDYQYFITEGPQFVSRFNALALKLRNLLIPVSIPMAQRWKWLNSFLFSDANVVKPQLYVPIQSGFYSLDYTSNTPDKPYKVKFNNLDKKSVPQQLDLLEDVINELLINDTIAVINADLLRSYGSENVVHVPMIMNNEDKLFNPIYSEEFLDQVQHLLITPISVEEYQVQLNSKSYDFNFYVYFNTDVITTSSEGPIYALDKAFITTNGQELTSPEVTIKTRMMTMLVDLPELSGGKSLMVCGTELYRSATILKLGENTVKASIQSSVINFTKDSDESEGTFSAKRKFIDLSTNFNQCPILYDYVYDEEGDYSSELFPVGQLNNYGVISYQTLAAIHTAVIASSVGLSDRTAIQTDLVARKTI